MLGNTISMLTPIRSSTKTSSRSEKPRLSFPTRNIMIIAVAARHAVGAVGNDIVGAMVAGTLVDVRLAPGIRWSLFFEVGSVPSIDSAGLLIERGKSFLRRRIAADIETKRVESGTQQLDLRFGGLSRGFFFLSDELRYHQTGEQGDNRHHDQQLDQGEALGIS